MKIACSLLGKKNRWKTGRGLDPTRRPAERCTSSSLPCIYPAWPYATGNGNDLVGQLIGKRGRFMNFLRQSSGAKIYVSTLPYFRDSQVCHIEVIGVAQKSSGSYIASHGSAHQVETVLSLIGKKFKELCLTNIYGLPPPTLLTLHSILMTAWLLLPDGVTVEVVVAHQVDAGHMFLHQHTHPTFHVLCSLDQQMYACYSHPAVPTLPTPVEVGIICAAPGLDGAWLRAQVISYFEETDEVELRYVDYGGYDKVKIDTLRQIRSDFLSLPFQGAEVLLDNVVPLPVALEMCAVLVSKAALLGGRLYPYCLGRRGFRLRRRRGVSSRTRPPNSSATYVHGNLASGFGKHFPLSLQQPSGHNTCVTSSLTDGFRQLPTATVGEDHFSSEADAAVAEMSRGAVLAAQVTNYDGATGLPLIQLWNLMGDEVVSINRTLVERGFAQWLDY
ncbi:A-kinase anchor protein 1, mitochondrial-like [Rhynochetos jubatus]